MEIVMLMFLGFVQERQGVTDSRTATENQGRIQDLGKEGSHQGFTLKFMVNFIFQNYMVNYKDFLQIIRCSGWIEVQII
jgi:hypothetical protein